MHIGKDIKDVFDNGPKTWTVTWFAGQLNCDRRNIYNIFERKSIDTELLIRIYQILNHNFFADIAAKIDWFMITDTPARNKMVSQCESIHHTNMEDMLNNNTNFAISSC